MKNEQIKLIQGFIDFCNSSLDNLTMTEKAWWAKNLSVLLGFLPSELFFFVSKTGEVREDHWKEIKDLQNEISEDLYWLFKYIKNKELYLQINAPRGFLSGDVFRYGDSEDCRERVTIKIYKRNPTNYEDSDAFEIKSVHQCFESFLKAIDGLEASSLLRCPICKNIFFNPTKREKIYCAFRCQNTAAVRRLRASKKKDKKREK